MQTNDGRQIHLLKRLQTELRNEGKTNYREYIITVSTNGYRIGRVIGDESVGHVVYHVHCNTVAECIEWIDTQKRKGQTIDFESCIEKKDTPSFENLIVFQCDDLMLLLITDTTHGIETGYRIDEVEIRHIADIACECDNWIFSYRYDIGHRTYLMFRK